MMIYVSKENKRVWVWVWVWSHKLLMTPRYKCKVYYYRCSITSYSNKNMYEENAMQLNATTDSLLGSARLPGTVMYKEYNFLDAA